MFFETAATDPNPIEVASHILYSLAPAFAVGFAIQRLLEIADSFISLDKKIGPEWKSAFLSGTSLIVGTGLAFLLDIRILKVLEAGDVSKVLDFLVSGLIISAGTDGFNSIVKFLSYAKETKRAEAITEEETAISARGARMWKSYAMSVVTPGFEPSGDPEKDLKTVLHDQIKGQWPTKFVEDGWEKRKFEVFESTADVAKILVREATLIVARAYSKQISKESIIRLQSLVTTAKTPADILPEMLVVLLSGTP